MWPTSARNSVPWSPPAQASVSHRTGALVTICAGLVLLAIAGSVDFPKAGLGFKGDEATYYMLGHSLARDADFAYERHDLIRVWEEYHAPEGVFLKRGKTVSFSVDSAFPFVHRVTRDEPTETRLYFGKAYIYPLAASPFVWLFGTNGFLIFHAFLLTLDLWLAYLWLSARGLRSPAAAAFAAVFFVGSIVPLYFVWLTPEIFNFSLVLAAVFLWTYKEVAPGVEGFLGSRRSDVLSAVLIGVVTFSKPTHAPLIAPLVLVAAWRRQWWHALTLGVFFTAVAAGLFALNAAITGEFNYQGGYRKTFYSSTGFPFANERERFDNIARVHGRSETQTDILVNRHTGQVFRSNLVYFFFGRYSGLVPYFFPGIVALVLFLVRRGSRLGWQWLLLGTLLIEMVALLFITPYTWAGGGGPVGNRYFLSFYPLFLFLMPPVQAFAPAVIALGFGALFTAKMVFNPFWTSFHPNEHAKHGPLRLLPIELTMLNDLPLAANPDRARQRLQQDVMAYFPDDHAYPPEGDSFWLRGGGRADVILRAPLQDLGQGRWLGRQIARFRITVVNGAKPNTVTIDTGRDSEVLTMTPGETRTVVLDMPRGVPYRPYETPTSWVYVVSFETTDGFVPFLETPPSGDARYLGAVVTMAPEFMAN